MAIFDNKAFKVAGDMIDMHGLQAHIAANAYAEESKMKGNIVSYAFWYNVEQAIDVIQSVHMDEKLN